MAERRMFAKTIIDSDSFLDLPLSAQALYFHLSMRADDEGFVDNPKRIQKMIGANSDDIKLLILKRFVIACDSGILVIRHWKIHNYIQSDRFRPTVYLEERAKLMLDDNKVYVEKSDVYSLDTPCIQPVSNLDTQVRLGKVSIGERSNSLLKILKNKLKNAGAYTGVFDALVDEVLAAIAKACELPNSITLDGEKYTAEDFKQLADNLTYEQVAFTVNRLLHRGDEVQNREIYIMSVIASKYANKQ